LQAALVSSNDHTGKTRVGISDQAYHAAWRRAAAIVAKMTLAEKCQQVNNPGGQGPARPGTGVPGIKRLGLPAYNYASDEGLHGLVDPFVATSFPVPLAMACSWNPALARSVYTAVSDEAWAYHKKENWGLSFYSPQTLNLHRDPRWGRCEEAPGEDPCLASTWAVEVVRGMQGDDPNYLKTTACAKHFICNNTDSDRQSVSAPVDARSFWEYYTRAYQACVLQGDAFTVMGAYNAINGVPCCADRFLLTDLLRKRWGFRGYVTSDNPAVYNIYKPHHYVPTMHQAAALGIQAGCDLIRCSASNEMVGSLARAVSLELVSEADISLSITRLLTVRILLGDLDPLESVPYNRINFDVVDSPAHRAMALDAARQSIVLLKNQNQLLPLDKSKLQTVAVIGPTAGFHLGGYSGHPAVRISPYEGIAHALGVVVVPHHGQVWPDELKAVSAGVQTQASSENGRNISRIKNGDWAQYRPQDFTGKNHIAIRVAGIAAGALIHVHIDALDGPEIATLKVPSTGGWQRWTTISASLSGVAGKHQVFFKFSGPGRKGVCNMEWFRLEPVITAPIPQPRPGHPVLIFKPGCSVDGPKDDTMFAEAVAAAKQADVVIMVCGVDQSVDREGYDRKDIKLTGVQHDLIKACHAVNSNIVLVLSSNNTVAVNWEQEHLPAIVSSMFGGQAQGTAIADVLFGNYNPGGKTCCTWYKSVDQLPPFHNYDIMKGRTYMYFDGEPLYPFGYGLSYTTFKINDLKINSGALSAGGSLTVSCRVQNTGACAGAEVVQFYITAPASPVKRPMKELVGFHRVELDPGESKTITFTLPYTAQALWYWHESMRKFVLQPGRLNLMIGSSSADIDLHGHAQLEPCTDSRLGGPETLSTVAIKAAVL
jgi:beta-glucosidase